MLGVVFAFTATLASFAGTPAGPTDRKVTECRALYGVPLGLPLADLPTLKFPYTLEQIEAEGAHYNVAKISVRKNLEIEATFADGLIERLETSSSGAITEKGVGVGSTLLDIQTAYPDGQFLYGRAENYSYFVFRTNVGYRFYFDEKDFPRDISSFEISKVDASKVRVKSVRLSSR